VLTRRNDKVLQNSAVKTKT